MKMRTMGFILVAGLLLAGCKDKAQSRIRELASMPALWETTLLVADPEMPELKTLVPMQDTYDPNFYEAFSDSAKRTKDFIPESVRAFSLPSFANKPREVTISLGDTVEVLAQAQNNTPVPVYLVRTRHNTYAWILAYHIADREGRRIASMR
jgi:hypothetical protein